MLTFIQDTGVTILSNSRRGSIELFAEILENLLSNPMKKTQLSLKCNLDYRTVTRYLSQLESLSHIDRSKMIVQSM